MTNIVSFPALNLELHINPVAFSIGGWKVYWYGIFIALGFALAVLYCSKRCKTVGISSDDLLDVLIFATPLSIIGARLYYCIFHFDYYFSRPSEIIRIWDGGLAIYGGLIVAILCVLVGCRIKKISAFAFLDLVGMGFLIGQILGRWGNFANAECFGRDIAQLSDGSYPFYAMLVSTHPESAVHPLFLYESTLNLLLFIGLHFFFRHRKYNGQVFLLYMAGYGAIRFFTEGIRGNDALLLWNTGIRVSQALAALFCVTCLVILAVIAIRTRIRRNDIALREMMEQINAPGVTTEENDTKEGEQE